LRILGGAPLDDLPPLPRAELLRSSFDEDGVWELVPLHRRAPEAEDLLALAYRPVFHETLGGPPAQLEHVWTRATRRYGVEPGAWAPHLPEDLVPRLRKCAELVRRAEQTALELAQPYLDQAAAQSAGNFLADLDREIYAETRSQPLLLPLGHALEGDLQALPEAELPVLAQTSARHYRTLARRIAILERAVLGPQTSPILTPRRPAHD
jgi:hypothetical protein